MPPVNDWSPWMRALQSVDEDSGTADIGADADARSAAMTPPPAPADTAGRGQPAQYGPQTNNFGANYPAYVPPSPEQQATNRIEDDKTAGIRGTTPQSDAGGPLKGEIADEQAQLARMNQPTQQTLKQRVLSGVGRGLEGAALGWQGKNDEIATLRDKQAARVQQQREDLSNRISQNTRALSQEQLQQEGQTLRERMAAQGQIAAAQRLGETIRGRADVAQGNQDTRRDVASMTQAGATRRTQMQQEGANTRATNSQAQQYKEFQSTDQYRRWKAQMDDQTKLHIAQLQQGKAPAALMQTAVFAQGGIKSLNDAESAMAKLEQAGVMGSSWGQNKVEDWIFGKGAVDPSVPPDVRKTIGELRQSLNLSASAMTRAHTQRGSKEVYDDLKRNLGPGQDWAALRGAISESQDMLGLYVKAASDQSITTIRQGGGGSAPTPAANTPPRPSHVPGNYTYNANGPKGKGWYAPTKQ